MLVCQRVHLLLDSPGARLVLALHAIAVQSQKRIRIHRDVVDLRAYRGFLDTHSVYSVALMFDIYIYINMMIYVDSCWKVKGFGAQTTPKSDPSPPSGNLGLKLAQFDDLPHSPPSVQASPGRSIKSTITKWPGS